MKPILFNTEMMRAIQNGTKTVTRRVLKPKYTNTEIIILKNGKAFETAGTPSTAVEIKLPYQVGDILYVRETHALYDCEKDCPALKHKDFPKCNGENTKFYIYATDACVQSPCGVWEMPYKWKPSIRMPKEAARIFLRITDVRVERVQNMTLNDFLAEGIVLRPETFSNPDNAYLQARSEYSRVWNSTIKKSDLDKYGWSANPWVTVNEFERMSKEEAYEKENKA